MKDFRFYLPTDIRFGRGAEREVGKLAATYGTRVLILYGSERVRKSGLLDQIRNCLNEQKVSAVEFGGITENPLLSKAEEACRIVHEEKIDFLLPVGGGSVIDTAKAVSIGSCHDIPIWDFYENREEPQQALPIGVVLTIAATASEANCVSVLTNEKCNKKRAYATPLFYPRFALLNPELTFSVPGRQTAICGVDIFSHAFERYFHLGQTGTLRSHLCAAIMKTVVSELPKAQKIPDDYDCRSQIMWAATMAHSDMIGTEGVFACHEMSHVLTEEYGLAHGEALGILMPAWCRYMKNNHARELAKFACDVWEVDCTNQSAEDVAQEGIDRMQAFIRRCGLPITLREAGILQSDSVGLAELTVEKDECLGENFQKLFRAEIRDIYELCCG